MIQQIRRYLKKFRLGMIPFILASLGCIIIFAAWVRSYNVESAWSLFSHRHHWEVVLEDGSLRIDNHPQIQDETIAAVERDRKVNELLDALDTFVEDHGFAGSFNPASTPRAGAQSVLELNDLAAEQLRMMDQLKVLGFPPSPVTPFYMDTPFTAVSVGKHYEDRERLKGFYDPEAVFPMSSYGVPFAPTLLPAPNIPFGWYSLMKRIPIHVPAVVSSLQTHELPLFVLLAPSALYVIGRLMRMLVYLRRRNKYQCTACGYDLRTNSGRCPECGVVVPVHPARRPPFTISFPKIAFRKIALPKIRTPAFLVPFVLPHIYPLAAFGYFCGIIVGLHAPMELYRGAVAVMGENLIHDSWLMRLGFCLGELSCGLGLMFASCRLAVTVESRREMMSRELRVSAAMLPDDQESRICESAIP